MEKSVNKHITGRDCSETLLTCCIPNLKLNSLAIKFNSSDLKINTVYGRIVLSEVENLQNWK